MGSALHRERLLSTASNSSIKVNLVNLYFFCTTLNLGLASVVLFTVRSIYVRPVCKITAHGMQETANMLVPAYARINPKDQLLTVIVRASHIQYAKSPNLEPSRRRRLVNYTIEGYHMSTDVNPHQRFAVAGYGR